MNIFINDLTLLTSPNLTSINSSLLILRNCGRYRCC